MLSALTMHENCQNGRQTQSTADCTSTPSVRGPPLSHPNWTMSASLRADVFVGQVEKDFGNPSRPKIASIARVRRPEKALVTLGLEGGLP
jgi:hypothetical protein